VTVTIPHEAVEELAAIGVDAFITTRAAGTFGTNGEEPVKDVMGRWSELVDELRPNAPRLATARQVHGARVITHDSRWEGWLRADAADGHLAPQPGTALAVTIADCVPVFLAHPAGAVALLHAGWRGTAARILAAGVRAMAAAGFAAGDLVAHFGPGICGRCYEVGPDVYAALTGRRVDAPCHVDLREVLADQARALGIRMASTSRWCTRCDNDRFYSHRAGDAGRQIAVICVHLDSP
jgi:YfiH family protein